MRFPRQFIDLRLPHFTESSGEKILSLTQDIPRARSSVAWTRLPDGAVLFSPDSEVYFAVNQTGALIWELLVGEGFGGDICAICSVVEMRFPDIPAQQIRDDVAEILNAFADNNLLAEPEQKFVA
jgi:hypothetical protein